MSIIIHTCTLNMHAHTNVHVHVLCTVHVTCSGLISVLQSSLCLPGEVFGSEVKMEGDMGKVLPVSGEYISLWMGVSFV